jgi:hypothetical protein
MGKVRNLIDDDECYGTVRTMRGPESDTCTFGE